MQVAQFHEKKKNLQNIEIDPLFFIHLNLVL